MEKQQLTIDWSTIPHPKTFNIQALQIWAFKNILESCPYITIKEISKEMGLSSRSVARLLKKYDFRTSWGSKRTEVSIKYLESLGYEVIKMSKIESKKDYEEEGLKKL